MRRCRSCGSDYGDELAFCPQDGAPLTTLGLAATPRPAPPPGARVEATIGGGRSSAPYMTPPRAGGVAPTAIADTAMPSSAIAPAGPSLSGASSVAPASIPTGAAPFGSTAGSASGAAAASLSPSSAGAVVTATAPLDLTPQPLEVTGQVIADRYRVARKLGEGGMGEVYECHHIYIEKRVALKLLRREILSNTEAVTRFHQEARAASSIGHRNIVDIDDFGRLADGRVYLAMEYLDGESLADVMRRGMELPRALDILVQVCRGLSAAHAKGIVHRDMKPENVFLAREPDGRDLVKILDFGIAKVAGTDGSGSNLTRTGTIFGTPNYMSPEQALGRSLDPRSDIYSVGIILYELFVGVVPFRAESFMGILSLHITAEPVPPSKQAPERNVPPEIERIIMRTLEKDPARRFATMAELGDELARLAADEGVQTDVARPRDVRGGAAAARPATLSEPAAGSAPRWGAATAAPSATADPEKGLATASGELELEDEEGAPRRGGLGWLLIVVVLAVGGGGVAWRYLGKGHPTQSPGATTQPAPSPVASPEQERALTISTVPAGVEVFHGARRLGVTPLTVDFITAGSPNGGGVITLTLKKAGYRDHKVDVRPSQTRVQATLEPLAPPVQRPTPTPPAIDDPAPPVDAGLGAELAPPVAADEPAGRSGGSPASHGAGEGAGRGKGRGKGRSTPPVRPAPPEGPELYERLDSLPTP